MTVLALSPVTGQCDPTTQTPIASVANPPMSYDSTLGGTTTGSTPISQGLQPAYPNLAATCYEINGNGPVYVWNTTSGWKQI